MLSQTPKESLSPLWDSILTLEASVSILKSVDKTPSFRPWLIKSFYKAVRMGRERNKWYLSTQDTQISIRILLPYGQISPVLSSQPAMNVSSFISKVCAVVLISTIMALRIKCGLTHVSVLRIYWDGLCSLIHDSFAVLFRKNLKQICLFTSGRYNVFFHLLFSPQYIKFLNCVIQVLSIFFIYLICHILKEVCYLP